MDLVTKEQVRAARRADLYRFLDQNHPNEVRREGDSLRLRDNPSVSVKQGYSGYLDFSTGDSGNAVDFLVDYLGYDFQEAVIALSGDSLITPKPIQQVVRPPFILPEPIAAPPMQLMAYLTGHRCLPSEVVEELLREELIYQEATHNNIVFLNYERCYAELRGTVPDAPFKGMVPGSDPAACFWFQNSLPESTPDVVYICEGAIDAISLYCIHRVHRYAPITMYASIGGAANQKRIDNLKTQLPDSRIVIAVDNDDAGQKCRDRNPDCWTCVPHLKDWNEDWKAYRASVDAI